MNKSLVKRELWRFSFAQLSAQVATVADYAVSLFLAEVMGLWYLTASCAGAVTGGVVNCLVNSRWVFGIDGQKKRNVAMKYLFVWTGSIWLNIAGTYWLTEASGQYFIFTKAAVGITVALLWNYQLQRLFVYKNLHKKEI